MSITYPTTNLKVPSGITALPSGMKRPAFGTLYGFDAQGGGVASGFNIDVRDTEANILVRTGDATGVIAYGTDTEDLYVYDGTNWQIYNNDGYFNIDVRDTKANILSRSGDAVGVIAFVTAGENQDDLLVYDGTNWQIYNNS